MTLFARIGCCCAVLAGMGMGCRTPPPSPYAPPTEIGVVTLGMDAKDYEMAASKIAQEMLKRKLPRGSVVALGPVDIKDTETKKAHGETIDTEALQDRVAAILDQEGTLRFTSAIDASVGSKAAQEIYKIMEYNWWHNNPLDSEDLQKFGKLANIRGILFGRISVIYRKNPAGGGEVTYTFSWKLTDTETGVDILRTIYDIRKYVRD